MLPGSEALFCGGHCHCSLAETDDAAGGKLADVPVHRAADDEGDGDGEARLEPGVPKVENRNARVWLDWAKGVVRNRRDGSVLGAHALPFDAAVWVAAEKRLLRSASGSVG